MGLALTGYRGHQIHWYRWVLHQQVTGVSRYIGTGESCTDRLQGSADTLVQVGLAPTGYTGRQVHWYPHQFYTIIIIDAVSRGAGGGGVGRGDASNTFIIVVILKSF